ncbi:MAG: sensor domain-containing protein [Spirulinaceae cyanobacterium]
MEPLNFSLLRQISVGDWQNTPSPVRQWVETFLASTAFPHDEGRLIQILDATPVGIAVHDATGKIIYLNRVGQTLVGIERPLPLSVEQLSAAFQVYREESQQLYPTNELPSTRALDGEAAWADDLVVQRGDRTLNLEVWATPIFDEQGGVIYAIAAFQDISERKRQELEQQILENTVRQNGFNDGYVLQAQVDLIVRSQPDTTITFANPAFCDYVGRPLKVLLGQQWRQFVPPEDRVELQNKIAALTPEHPTFENINRQCQSTNQIGWTHWINVGIFDPQGNLTEIQGVGRDITALQQQIQREKSLRRVFQSIRNSLDLETIFATATAETARLLDNLDCFVVQYLPWANHWRHLSEFRHDPQAPTTIGLAIPDADNAFAAALKRREVVQVVNTQQLQDGINQAIAQTLPGAWLLIPLVVDDEVWGSFTLSTAEHPFRWQADQVELAQAVAHQLEVAIHQASLYQQVQLQLGERQRVETALGESESRYRLLAENMNDLVCLHDPDGCYRYVSPSCQSLLGYSPQEMLGCPLDAFIYPSDRARVRREIELAIASGRPTPITYRMRHKSSNHLWFEMLLKPIADRSGQITQLQTTSRDVTERIEAQNQLKHKALHDGLTNLPNRTLLIERLELALHRLQRSPQHQFAVLFLDLDRFKVINDSLGHLAGDQLLMGVAQKLQRTVQATDLVVRLGGDEFVVLLEEVQGIEPVIRVAEAIFARLKRPLRIEGRTVYTTASIGIVVGSPKYTDASQLLRDADIAMYRAKTNGKARYEIFDVQMHQQALERLHLENDLRRAIERQEFVLYYQPIVALDSQALIGFEALLRWQHPIQGLKSPDSFIKIAEETGLITHIDMWALDVACRQLKTWQTGLPTLRPLRMSVNLSAHDLRRADLLDQVDRILTETQLSQDALNLEITESMLIDDIEATIATLEQFRARGIQVSIDDFGTGYSSLSYLHRLPVASLKVDRSFVNEMLKGKRNRQIVETIIAMSNHLELKAIAEGIETEEQLDHLRTLGYQFGQGYFFAKPLSPDAAESLLHQTSQFRTRP